jgi:hypothetical protein
MATITQQQNLERFGELVLANRELHDQLRAAADQEAFVALAVQLGAAHGCEFAATVVQAAINEKRRAWLERWL